jgi:hypothetical protein
MSNYTGSVPDTRRAPDWRSTAACGNKNVDPEIFFDGYAEKDAKALCGRCPAVRACLQFALTEGIQDGVYGGLNAQERASLRRSTQRKAAKAKPKAAPLATAPKPTSLRQIWNNNASPIGNGHIAWLGNRQLWFKSLPYSARKIAFILDRGRDPQGRVTVTCELNGCVNPRHLVDDTERVWCGTRAGYRKHLKERTEICARCRKANSAADTRLRRTGTSIAA